MLPLIAFSFNDCSRDCWIAVGSLKKCGNFHPIFDTSQGGFPFLVFITEALRDSGNTYVCRHATLFATSLRYDSGIWLYENCGRIQRFVTRQSSWRQNVGKQKENWVLFKRQTMRIILCQILSFEGRKSYCFCHVKF